MLWSVYWGNQIQPPLYNRSLYIQVPKNSVSSSGFNAMQMLTSSKDKILIHSKSAVSRLKKYILWILKSEFICEENINLWQIVRQQQFKKCTIDLASNATYVLQGVWEKSILRKNVIFNPSYKYWALALWAHTHKIKIPFLLHGLMSFLFMISILKKVKMMSMVKVCFSRFIVKCFSSLLSSIIGYVWFWIWLHFDRQNENYSSIISLLKNLKSKLIMEFLTL